MKKILINKARCPNCLDEIESTHRHDFVWCRCGSLAVDGGKDYLKRMGDIHNYQDLSEYARCKKCGTDIEYLSGFSHPNNPLIKPYIKDNKFYGIWYCPNCNKEYK